MVRFVVGPDGSVLPDVAGRLPGRGMWLSARRDVLDTPRARAALARAARAAAGARAKVSVPDDLADRTRAALASRIADLIGMARRAGQAVAGHDRVLEWAARGRLGLLVQASDGAAGGRERLARQAGAGADAVTGPLPGDALGRIFGRDHAVHVGIAPGRLAAMIAAECRRLAALEPPAPAADGLQAGTKSVTDGTSRREKPGGTGTDTE
jgi:predicted RNA-binding protein YlxR (DUF448 family)